MIQGRANELADFQVFRTILKYCIVIICLPVTSFFVTKIFLFDAVFGLASIPSNVYAAVISIIVLHVTLGMYIYRAYSEADRVKPIKVD